MIFDGVVCYRKWLVHRYWTAGVRLGVRLCFGLVVAGHAQAASLYQCPGNLFTNQLDAERARAQGCRLAGVAGWSQGQRTAVLAEPSRPEAPALAAAVVAPALSTERNKRRTVPSPAPLQSQSPPAQELAGAQPASAQGRRIDVAVQQARDRDAVLILQAELARIQAQQQVLVADGGTSSGSGPALQRLRADEIALRKELSRHQR